MDRQYLCKIGIKLVGDLEVCSRRYDVKSHAHEVLAWEAVGMRGMIAQLSESKRLTYRFSRSTLVGRWGDSLVNELPELAERVSKFRIDYMAVRDQECASL